MFSKTGHIKQAFGWGALLSAPSIILPSLGRTLKNINTKRKAENAWADALHDDPMKGMVPGLEEEFKDLYFDSPHAAETLLRMF